MIPPSPSTLELQDQADRRVVRLALKTAWPDAMADEQARIDRLLEQLKPASVRHAPPGRVSSV